jgi:elongation factor 1 alpha-like protein
MIATQECLINITDKLDPPGRAIEAPFRFPITNLFKGQNAASSGVAVSGRLYSGVIQVGERVRVLPGDETAVIKSEWATHAPRDFVTWNET